MNVFLKRLLKPLYSIIGMGYGRCHCCGAPWNIVDEHTVPINGNGGCFAVCEDCWNTKSDDEIIEAHKSLYYEWLHGDAINQPLSEEEIGFSFDILQESVINELNKKRDEETD